MEFLLKTLFGALFSALAFVALLRRIAKQGRKTAEPVKEQPASWEKWLSVPESIPASTAAPETPNFASEADPRLPQSVRTTEATSAPYIEADKPITGTFDLRAAILYSEILKPKFDE